ncbi:hypothetical protein DICPUDRAFT_91670 [Dictyostelium purpureum]|uniref:CBS domain-containing protein n=1 Tax=Dictyostelium purpureum TaxID=5786 RepID=F0ZFM0_DICPU|nr:uncharacterized protein DICPUDRAFT_91670 [Dictyostelium purpureum]EGC37237.1 hypothetical protein DICPUDRAFT_91670 [Dictyostelium purpureum]|eukprot:XP_003286207.1 hypothetical protein DICPUDRAFT_91670 [Dictyostelium purpureum]
MELLKTLKASSPVFPNDSSTIKAVNMTDPIETGLKQLISNNILSAPVYNPIEKKYYCFFSMLDVINEIVQNTSGNELNMGDISTVLSVMQEKNLLKKTIISDIADNSKRDPFIVVDSESTLDKVTCLMVKNNIRRIAVLNQRGELCNVITNSRIIECISHLFEMDRELEILGKRTIKEMKIGHKEVISIEQNKRALDAFRLISEMGVSGIAVLNEKRELVGSISDGDLRLIKSKCQYLSLLNLPIKEYLEALKKITDYKSTFLTCRSNDTFKEIVQSIGEKRAHRVFIINTHNQLEGVLSLQDILEQIVLPQDLLKKKN